MTPIRKLTGNLEEKYLSMNHEVEQLHEMLVGKMNNYIIADPTPNVFYGPAVMFDEKRQIIVSESYLNYIWSSIYFIFVFHEEASAELLKNPSKDFLDMNATPLRKEAMKLFTYFKQIAKNRCYIKWPNDTISPLFNGCPKNDIEDFALKVNGLYSTGMATLFFHELGHIYLNHEEEAKLQEELKEKLEYERRTNPKFELNQDDVAPIISAETAADNFAFDLVLRDYDSSEVKLNNSIAVLSVYLALLLSSYTLKGLKQIFHPNLHERILRIIQRIEQMHIKESGYFSHMAIHILVFLLSQSGITLESYDAQDKPYDYLLMLMEKIDENIL